MRSPPAGALPTVDSRVAESLTGAPATRRIHARVSRHKCRAGRPTLFSIADRQIQLIAGHAPPHRPPAARCPPPAAKPRLRVRVRVRARPFSGKRYTNFQQLQRQFQPEMLHAGCLVRTSRLPQPTPALDEATVVWSVWRSPHASQIFVLSRSALAGACARLNSALALSRAG